MGLFNLLSGDVGIAVIGNTFDISLNWIGKLIRLLIENIGSVGIGIILFSVILKAIVLPFDVYQRISMRKQNIKMKENQAKMEKLQKQYANDKEKYNQKVMEMYKESGFSMFSSCLPMILSMVIFIVAINAFNAYAQYSNVNNYNIMVNAYNAGITRHAPDITEENVSLSGDKLLIKDADDKDKYIYYTVAYDSAYADNGYAYIQKAKKEYFIDVEKAYAKAEIKASVDKAIADASAAGKTLEKSDAVKEYIVSQAQSEVVVSYNSTVIKNTKFGWIKNIWATDASYKHPVLGYSDFKTEVEREKFAVNSGKVAFGSITSYTNAYDADSYNTVTAKLSAQKNQANGYYVLIILSIGTILLQQWISQLGQKEQQKYSSVDGQGASQQKMTMVIMTVMFAIFSFMYSSAFSIYMIMSNILSLISTLVINKIVDVVQNKKDEKALQEQYNKRFPGRVAPGSEKKDKKNK
ncbi:MAG: YidC/Oxa1 family membrane protein insertase [Clostridia bacterium]|nr:YidC/Oxa1 family membrane protein insertase [Clostridia bacterium]